jgi:hypothetical protein
MKSHGTALSHDHICATVAGAVYKVYKLCMIMGSVEFFYNFAMARVMKRNPAIFVIVKILLKANGERENGKTFSPFSQFSYIRHFRHRQIFSR